MKHVNQGVYFSPTEHKTTRENSKTKRRRPQRRGKPTPHYHGSYRNHNRNLNGVRAACGYQIICRNGDKKKGQQERKRIRKEHKMHGHERSQSKKNSKKHTHVSQSHHTQHISQAQLQTEHEHRTLHMKRHEGKMPQHKLSAKSSKPQIFDFGPIRNYFGPIKNFNLEENQKDFRNKNNSSKNVGSISQSQNDYSDMRSQAENKPKLCTVARLRKHHVVYNEGQLRSQHNLALGIQRRKDDEYLSQLQKLSEQQQDIQKMKPPSSTKSRRNPIISRPKKLKATSLEERNIKLLIGEQRRLHNAKMLKRDALIDVQAQFSTLSGTFTHGLWTN